MSAQVALVSDAIRVDPPPDGCWVARSCELRVRAMAPLQLSTATPTVRWPSASTLEVLRIEAPSLSGMHGGRPDAWIVRVIAFEPGDVATPSLRVEVLDTADRRAIIDAPIRTITVHGRALAASSPLADLLPLPPSLVDVLVWSAVLLSAAFVISALMSLLIKRRHRLVAWTRSRLTATRARRRARRLLRRPATDAEPGRVYDRIIEALRVALTPNLGRSVVALTSPELVALAARSRMPDPDRQLLATLLATTDIVRFAGHVPSPAETASDLARARIVIRSRIAEADRKPRLLVTADVGGFGGHIPPPADAADDLARAGIDIRSPHVTDPSGPGQAKAARERHEQAERVQAEPRGQQPQGRPPQPPPPEVNR